MHMENQELLLRHRILITIETVDHDGANVFLFDTTADPVRELSRRDFGRVHLFDHEIASVTQRLQIDAQRLGAGKQQS